MFTVFCPTVLLSVLKNEGAARIRQAKYIIIIRYPNRPLQYMKLTPKKKL